MKTNIIGEHIVSFEKGLIHTQKYKNESRNKLTVFKRQIAEYYGRIMHH